MGPGAGGRGVIRCRAPVLGPLHSHCGPGADGVAAQGFELVGTGKPLNGRTRQGGFPQRHEQSRKAWTYAWEGSDSEVQAVMAPPTAGPGPAAQPKRKAYSASRYASRYPGGGGGTEALKGKTLTMAATPPAKATRTQFLRKGTRPSSALESRSPSSRAGSANFLSPSRKQLARAYATEFERSTPGVGTYSPTYETMERNRSPSPNMNTRWATGGCTPYIEEALGNMRLLESRSEPVPVHTPPKKPFKRDGRKSPYNAGRAKRKKVKPAPVRVPEPAPAWPPDQGKEDGGTPQPSGRAPRHPLSVDTEGSPAATASDGRGPSPSPSPSSPDRHFRYKSRRTRDFMERARSPEVYRRGSYRKKEQGRQFLGDISRIETEFVPSPGASPVSSPAHPIRYDSVRDALDSASRALAHRFYSPGHYGPEEESGNPAVRRSLF